MPQFDPIYQANIQVSWDFTTDCLPILEHRPQFALRSAKESAKQARQPAL